jgi:hypothetical protein
VICHHGNLPGYPGPPDLEKLGLIPQGMPWEQVLPRDKYFDFELESKNRLQNPKIAKYLYTYKKYAVLSVHYWEQWS